MYSEYTLIKELVTNKEYAEGLEKILELHEQSKLENNEYIHYSSAFLIGEIYRLTGDYKKCLPYYKESLEIIETDRERKDEYRFFGDDNYGKNLLRVASVLLNLKSLDSARVYSDKILMIESDSGKVQIYKAATHTNLAGMYQLDSLYNQAEVHAELAEDIYRNRHNKISQARAINNLANIYLLKKEFRRASEKYNDGIKLIENENSSSAIKLRSNLYFNLAWSLRRLNRYESYDVLEVSYNIKDNLRNDQLKQSLERIQGEYNVNLVRKEEELKRQQVEVKQQKAERNTWVIGISLVSVIVFLGFLLNQFKLRQKNLRLALSQKETESQMEVLNANIIGQEEERKRISQELHDGVLSRLFASRMGLGYLELDSDFETQNQYQKYLEELQSIEKEIREVSHKLSSNISLSETSFLNAINQLLKGKSKLGNFDFRLKMDDSFSWKELDGIVEMNLFRILQESLQNIIKHAEAKQVSVSFKVENAQLLVSIVDDGVGFDTTQKVKGIGLKNIQSRVQNMNGSVKILSGNNQGATLFVKIPI